MLNRRLLSLDPAAAKPWGCWPRTGSVRLQRHLAGGPVGERCVAERGGLPEDRRIKTVAITPAGQKVKAELLREIYEPGDEVLNLSRTERVALTHFLRKVVPSGSQTTMRRDESQPKPSHDSRFDLPGGGSRTRGSVVSSSRRACSGPRSGRSSSRGSLGSASSRSCSRCLVNTSSRLVVSSGLIRPSAMPTDRSTSCPWLARTSQPLAS